jgi:hypothetical protein
MLPNNGKVLIFSDVISSYNNNVTTVYCNLISCASTPFGASAADQQQLQSIVLAQKPTSSHQRLTFATSSYGKESHALFICQLIYILSYTKFD